MEKKAGNFPAEEIGWMARGQNIARARGWLEENETARWYVQLF
jgi:hypothetical protein